jgi:hypothetical protein
VPAAAAASPAAAPATLATLKSVARNLTQLAACLDTGALLASGCWCGGVRDSLRWTRADVPVPLVPRAPVLIALVVAPIAISPVIAASLGAPAITVTAPLAALGAARLSRVLPSAVAIPVAAGR